MVRDAKIQVWDKKRSNFFQKCTRYHFNETFIKYEKLLITLLSHDKNYKAHKPEECFARFPDSIVSDGFPSEW